LECFHYDIANMIDDERIDMALHRRRLGDWGGR
jgi:hypothetical protein